MRAGQRMPKEGSCLNSTQQELVRPKTEKQTKVKFELRGCEEKEENDDDGIFMEMFDEREHIEEEEQKNERDGNVVREIEEGDEGYGLS